MVSIVTVPTLTTTEAGTLLVASGHNGVRDTIVLRLPVGIPNR
jgi:hypothetical protein